MEKNRADEESGSHVLYGTGKETEDVVIKYNSSLQVTEVPSQRRKMSLVQCDPCSDQYQGLNVAKTHWQNSVHSQRNFLCLVDGLKSSELLIG